MGVKISEMDAAAALTGAELIELVQSGSNVRSTVSALGSQVGTAINPVWYGALFDNLTNDTIAIQAAIVAAEAVPYGAVYLPGMALVTGVTITKPVKIFGASQWGSGLKLISGSTVPVVNIAVTDATFNPYSDAVGDVVFQNMMITSQDRTNGPGQNVAHGIALVSQATSHRVAVILDTVQIQNVPADGIHVVWTGGHQYPGYFWTINCTILYCNRNGIFCNSSTDNQFTQTIVGVCGANGIVVSGGGFMAFNAVNSFFNVEDGYLFFETENNRVSNSIIESNGQDGVYAELTAGQRLDLIGNTHRATNSTSANLTFGDLHLPATNAGNIYLTAAKFATPAASTTPNKQAANIISNGGNTGKIYTSNVTFDAGTIYTAAVTNDATVIEAAFPANIASFEGAIVQSRAGAGLNHTINTTTPFAREFRINTNELQRWAWGGSAMAEAGANAGSNFFLSAYDDAGAFLSTPFSIVRSTGVVSITSGLSQQGNLGFYAATPVAKQTVTGSKGANAALASLLTALATLGLVTDSSS